MADLKQFKETVLDLTRQLNHCLLCGSQIDPNTDNFTFIYQKIQGQSTALGLLCGGCSLINIAHQAQVQVANIAKQENTNEIKLETMDK